MSALFINPLHNAFFHHSENHFHGSEKNTFSTAEKECAYCDFHFFHFTAETFFYSGLDITEHFYKLVYSFIAIWVSSKIFKHYSDRAPPSVFTNQISIHP